MRFGRRGLIISQESLQPLRLMRSAGWIAVAALAAALSTFTGMAVASPEEAARVDINRASVEELMSLPGVGPAKAKAIVEHRQTAPFKKTEELLQVRGIGDSIYADLRDRITVSEPAPASGGAGSPPAVAAERN
jgi:competence protein ComEA